jgi:hypothetical protein
MPKLSKVVGSTSEIWELFIQDSASTVGAGKTGLAYNTASLTCYYKRNTATGTTSVSLADIVALGTYVSGGFKEVDPSNMPGVYEFHPPNAALASGAQSVTFFFKGASGMVVLPLEVELTLTNNQDATRGGMSALPNANAAASGGLPTVDSNNAVKVQSGTGANQLSLSSGTVTVGTNNDKTGYGLADGAITAAKFGAGAIDAAAIADNAIDAGAIASNAITAAKIADGALTAAKFASGAFDAVWERATSALTTAGSIGKLLVDNINATISSRSTLTAANVWDYVVSSLGSTSTVGGYVKSIIDAIKAKTDSLTFTNAGKVDATAVTVSDKTGYSLASAPPTASDNADAVWDALLADHNVADTFGEFVQAITGGGDGGLTAAQFFTTDSGKVYADAIAGSVVKEIVLGLRGQLQDAGIAADTIAVTILQKVVASYAVNGNVADALNKISAIPSQVSTELNDLLSVDTQTELTGVPPANATLAQMIRWMYLLSRNPRTQTSSTQTVRNDANSATVATSGVSDNGTTLTQGKWS